MNGAASEAEATRARPPSGLWSLLSWLRRDDSGASSDSLSSVGSDRTVASFAFLSPARSRRPTGPAPAPPPDPPTDSYRRRVRDRDARILRDRDLTLHRKYGLFRGEGYDGFSLPPARKLSSEHGREERERRAASEGSQRRAAHVPGKRRAPAPPDGRSATLGARRRPRKRAAPQPPRRPLGEIGGNAPIPEEPLSTRPSAGPARDDPPARDAEVMDCAPEKYIKKEIADAKPRSEKSFLRQIFESRKRNSAVETIPERILPSISELDKQAAEIIRSCKLKALGRSDDGNAGASGDPTTPSGGDVWFCTRCLRKYNDSVVTCGHCVAEQKIKLGKVPCDGARRLANRASDHFTQTGGKNAPSSSGVNEMEEKQKLKEMLKEIKDSLPKRPKHDIGVKDDTNLTNGTNHKHMVVEAPTLRIGSKISEENPVLKVAIVATQMKTECDNNEQVVLNSTSTSATEKAVVTQPIVLQHVPSRDIVKLEDFKMADVKQRNSSPNSSEPSNKKININVVAAKESNIPVRKTKSASETTTTTNSPLNTPLKISSLLNSNPLPGRELSGNSSFVQSGNQHQLNISIPAASSYLEAKPLVASSNAQADINWNSTVQNIMISAASTAVNKDVHKNKLTPKDPNAQMPLKANTTTQTSNHVLVENPMKSKHNKIIIKDILNDKIERNSIMNNTTPVIATNSIPLTLPGVITSNTSSPSKQHVDSTKTKEANFPKSPAQSVIADEAPKLPLLRAEDHLQRNPVTKVVPLDLHSRRRDLINQLEQSIAKGDERAAADAAAKLAQLRLSCSVLSFSSQIVGAPSTSKSGPADKINDTVPANPQKNVIVAKTARLEPRKETDEIQNTSSKDVDTSSGKAQLEKKTNYTQSEVGNMEKNKNIINMPQTSKEPSRSKEEVETGSDNISIEVWIEDREAARGPIRMNMPRVSVIGDLRRQANATFGLAAHLQRWIVGRTLCTDDNATLNSLAGPGFDAPFYLCLVEPEANKHTVSNLGASSSINNKTEDKNQNVKETNEGATDVYAELVLLERRALVPNAEEFECGVCMEHYIAGQGAVLRECVHTFCRECLSDVVKHSEEPAVSCPAMGCPGFLQEREIRALVSEEDYERWLARGLAAAESGTRNAFHCRTRDCRGWALCEPGVMRFPCPVCKRTNCVACQAIHEGDTCEQYRAKQRAAEVASRAPEETDEGTRAFLDTLISRGEALECPECSTIITKKWGCDWIKCSACKTEICWVTRGRRWGPGGRGDTSAGCRCGVDGQRCHPSCGYCH